MNLVVLELNESYAIVSGSGGEKLRADDVVSGERLPPLPLADDRVGARRDGCC